MISRRIFLQGSAILGCSAAAHPLMSSVTLAAAPGDRRLVVIILRGAMDGLDMVQPYGDPNLRAARPSFAIGPEAGAHDLDGFFALSPLLSDLMPLWSAGELGFAQAVSTPYRDKRSHFDGQDMLEAGTGLDVPGELRRDGWLNRLLQSMPGARAETAFSVGEQELPILAGAAPSMSWAPEAKLTLSGQGRALLDHVYHDDPLFREAALEAMRITDADDPAMAVPEDEGEAEMEPSMMPSAQPPARQAATRSIEALAEFTAERLRGETRIAAFSINGWDTHRGQAGLIRGPAANLSAAILTLRAQLGAVWGETLVLAMTEFGRTLRENGTRGTDHGTGGAMVMAGGALRGGRVYGRWPGLAEADLYDRRDLMPTADIRSYAGWALRAMFGADRAQVEESIFPGLDLGADPGFLL